jgi:hypothetical protein
MPRSKKADAEKTSDVPKGSLRDEVREALRRVINDNTASAAAIASAGRTLLEHFDEENSANSGRRAVELTASELDEEIQRLTRSQS